MKKLLDRIKGDVLIIDKKGKIRYCNEQLGRKLRYQSNFISGWDLEKIVEDTKVFNQLHLHSEVGEEMVLRLKDKEGQVLQYACKVVIEEWEDLPAFVLIGKVREEHPEVSPSMRQVLNQIPCGVMIKGLNGRYTYMNQVAQENCGIKREEMLGKLDVEVWGEEKGKIVEREDDSILNTGIPKQVEIWTGKDELKLVKAYKFPFYQDKRLVGIIKICRDETLDWLLEHQLTENYEELLRIGSNMHRKESVFNQDCQEMRIEHCLIRELQAQGVNVLAYDAEKNQVINYFYEGVYKEIIEQEAIGCVSPDNLREVARDKRYHGVYPVEKSLFAKVKERFLSRGIKDVGVYPICYGQEFMGMLVMAYENYDYTGSREQKLDQEVCKRLAVILKQFELSRRLKEELERRRFAQEELEHLLDTAADVVKVVDKQGCIRMVSRSFCELVGKPKTQIIGSNYREFIHTKTSHSGWDQDKKIVCHYITPDNEGLWIEWRVKYIEEKEMYICIGTDITKSKELAEQQEAYEKQLQKEAIRNEFFIRISHEFRTPINMILSSLELINEIAKDSKIQTLCNEMRRNTYKLLGLVDNLMDMTEIDTGLAQLQLEEHNIVEVIEDIAELIISRVQMKSIHLVFDTEVEEQWMKCDSAKIQRAVGSMIGGAVDRIDDEGNIELEVKLTKEKVKVYMNDSGRAVREEELFITQAFVDMHGGQLAIQKTSEGENSICLELPLKVKGKCI